MKAYPGALEVEAILTPVALPLAIDAAKKPFVILVVGVNGSGKTTTIGKLAAQTSRQGRKVMLAAGDTFRAAAIEQLRVWGERPARRYAGEQGAIRRACLRCADAASERSTCCSSTPPGGCRTRPT